MNKINVQICIQQFYKTLKKIIILIIRKIDYISFVIV